VAFADGCTGECATNANSSAENSRDGLGSVYYLAAGPSLLLDMGDLGPLVEPSDMEMNKDCLHTIPCVAVERIEAED
jgi:hypothetical protein